MKTPSPKRKTTTTARSAKTNASGKKRSMSEAIAMPERARGASFM